MDLQDKTALVTGGAHRVGRAIALALAKAGCDLIIHYHTSEEAAVETQDMIESMGRRASIFPADLRDIEQLQSIFAEIASAGHSVDILINSAAIMEPTPFNEVNEAIWHRTIDLNLRALFFCTQLAATNMLPQGGVIINISDIAGHKPWVNYPVHSISKAGVEMLTKLAARAYAPKIRVNAIVPGPVLKPESLSENR